MGGKHISQKLIAEKSVLRPRQLRSIKHLREIAICQEDLFPGTLKIALSEFCLDQQVAQSQINFCAIKSAVEKRNAGSVP